MKESSTIIKQIKDLKHGVCKGVSHDVALYTSKMAVLDGMTKLAGNNKTYGGFYVKGLISEATGMDEDDFEFNLNELMEDLERELYENEGFLIENRGNSVLVVSLEPFDTGSLFIEFEMVSNTNYDAEANCYTIDAWELGKDEGRVIAIVNATTGDTYWIDNMAYANSERAKEAVRERVAKVKEQHKFEDEEWYYD